MNVRGPDDEAEHLERALASDRSDERETEALADLARSLSELWSALEEPATFGRVRARALAAFGRAGGRRRRRLATALAAAALLLLTSGTTLAGSRAVDLALPGDPLYPMKLALESVRVAMARGPAAEAAVYLDIAETRVEEMLRARATGHPTVLPELARRYADALTGYRRAVAGLPAMKAREVVARARAELEVHRRVLDELLGSLPAPAREGIARAIEVSSGAGDGHPFGSVAAGGTARAGFPSPGTEAPPRSGARAVAAERADAAAPLGGVEPAEPYPTSASVALQGNASRGGEGTCERGPVSRSERWDSCSPPASHRRPPT